MGCSAGTVTCSKGVPPTSSPIFGRASKSRCLRSLSDAGQFELNLGDERYLPFAGTGAVSSWTPAFRRHDKSGTQKALLDALTDVIVHVRYTPMDGGVSCAQQVAGTLTA
ncbi:hypothetical protein [Burkholderia ubonensis]|uniref:Tc toxin subunit A-related protein n=1 Tax=Burkholderia ubonensis TaxID=101571 RepID=UPI0039F4C68F